MKTLAEQGPEGENQRHSNNNGLTAVARPFDPAHLIPRPRWEKRRTPSQSGVRGIKRC